MVDVEQKMEIPPRPPEREKNIRPKTLGENNRGKTMIKRGRS
jgi:hypothetical protein